MSRSQLVDRLSASIASLVQLYPVRVAIDGLDAAGKTKLAEELTGPLKNRGRPVIRASIDGFHNPRKIRYKRGSKSAEGYYADSFNYAALKSFLLIPLGPEGSLQYQTKVFDFRTDSAVQTPVRHAAPEAILLFDGVFLLRPELHDCWDFTIFVDVEFEIILKRATVRDLPLFGSAAAVQERYRERYMPGQRLYLRNCRPKEQADVVVDNNDPLHPKMNYKL